MTSHFTGFKAHLIVRTYNQSFREIVPSALSNALKVEYYANEDPLKKSK